MGRLRAHIARVPKRIHVRGPQVLSRLKARFRRPGSSGRPKGEDGEPALVEPDRPRPLSGGAAAPVEEEA